MSYLMKLITSILLLTLSSSSVYASIVIGRTRVIFNAENMAQSFKIKNNSNQPYLVQSWVEDEQENKLTDPFMSLPPVQRIEADGESQIKIQGLPSLTKLPQDRESIFYLNILEVPPRLSKHNQVQLAMQSRIKLIYRPLSLKVGRRVDVIPGVEKMTFSCSKGKVKITNSTAYYMTLSTGKAWVMIPPKSEGLIIAEVGKDLPKLNYINDYGVKKSLISELVKGEGCDVYTRQ